MTPNRRRRGTAGGWIILLVVLAVVGGLIAWKMIYENQRTGVEKRPTTMPSPR